MRLKNKDIVVLYSFSASWNKQLSYFDDWLESFSTNPEVNALAINISKRHLAPSELRDISEAALVVLLHSTNGDDLTALEAILPTLMDRSGIVVAFIGNELNLPNIGISDKRKVLEKINPEYVATQLLQEAGDYLWGDIALNGVLCVPHALNELKFTPTQDRHDRQIDIGARGNRYSITLGDRDRNLITDLFEDLGQCGTLNVDISTKRYDRNGWSEFLNACRGTVSSEAGSWFLERDDATVSAIVEDASNQRPNVRTMSLPPKWQKLYSFLPSAARNIARKQAASKGILSVSDLLDLLDEEQVIRDYFDRDKPDFYGKCISSRHFDATGTLTTQILLEGRYNDILKPDIHYIELKADLSNFADVVEKIQDETLCATIAESARALAIDSHTYRHRVRRLLDQVLI